MSSIPTVDPSYDPQTTKQLIYNPNETFEPVQTEEEISELRYPPPICVSCKGIAVSPMLLSRCLSDSMFMCCACAARLPNAPCEEEEEAPRKECPCCKDPSCITSDLKGMIRLISKDILTVRCSCSAEVPIMEVQQHLEHDCPKSRFTCACGHEIQQAGIPRHYHEECGLRVVGCRYCSGNYHERDMREHLDNMHPECAFCHHRHSPGDEKHRARACPVEGCSCDVAECSFREHLSMNHSKGLDDYIESVEAEKAMTVRIKTQDAMHTRKQQALELQLHQHKDKVSSLENELDNLKLTFAESLSVNDLKIATLEKDLSTCSSSLEAKTKHNAKLTSQVMESSLRVTHLKADLARRARDLSGLRLEVATLKTRRTTLTDKLNVLTEELEHAASELTGSETARSQSERLLEACRDAHERTSTFLQAHVMKSDEVSKELIELRRRFTTFKGTLKCPGCKKRVAAGDITAHECSPRDVRNASKAIGPVPTVLELEVRVRCQYCRHLVDFGKLVTHRECCEQRPVDCPAMARTPAGEAAAAAAAPEGEAAPVCEWHGPHAAAAYHLKTECPLTEVTCPGCSQTMTRHALTAHKPACAPYVLWRQRTQRQLSHFSEQRVSQHIALREEGSMAAVVEEWEDCPTIYSVLSDHPGMTAGRSTWKLRVHSCSGYNNVIGVLPVSEELIAGYNLDDDSVITDHGIGLWHDGTIYIQKRIFSHVNTSFLAFGPGSDVSITLDMDALTVMFQLGDGRQQVVNMPASAAGKPHVIGVSMGRMEDSCSITECSWTM